MSAENGSNGSTTSVFEVGGKVYSPRFGDGVVADIVGGSMAVQFKCGVCAGYGSDGAGRAGDRVAVVDGHATVNKNLTVEMHVTFDDLVKQIADLTSEDIDHFKEWLIARRKPAIDTQKMIAEECDSIKGILLEKNRKYGNSALRPVRIFSKAPADEQIKVRLDDKLSRIASGQADDGEDSDLDLIGYLILKRIEKRAKA